MAGLAALADWAPNPSDLRRTLARLTADGEELLRNLRQGRKELPRSRLSQMDETYLCGLVRSLQVYERVAGEGSVGRGTATGASG